MKVFVVALAIFAALCTGAQADQRVRITNGEWQPYLSQNLPHYGLASRIITEAFALEDVQVTYGFFPWKRALEMARNGDWDAAAVWHRSAERERDFYVSDPVLMSNFVLFHRTDLDFDWNSLSDLRGYRIGATLGYDYGHAFTEAEQQRLIEVERVHRDELNFSKLLAGRIDLFPMDRIVGMDMLSRDQPPDRREQLTFHPVPLRSDGLHLLLSRKVPGNAELLQRSNRGLKRLRDSGRIAELTRELEAYLATQHQFPPHMPPLQ